MSILMSSSPSSRSFSSDRSSCVATECRVVSLDAGKHIVIQIAAERTAHYQEEVNVGADAERVGVEKECAATIKRLCLRQTGCRVIINPVHPNRVQMQHREDTLGQRAQAARCHEHLAPVGRRRVLFDIEGNVFDRCWRARLDKSCATLLFFFCGLFKALLFFLSAALFCARFAFAAVAFRSAVVARAVLV
jgi:hypothetical protein